MLNIYHMYIKEISNELKNLKWIVALRRLVA